MRALILFATTFGAASLLVAAATASSPGRNGALLVSLSRPADALGSTYTPASLYTVNAAGGLHLVVRDPAPIEFGSYSPDGATVAFPRLNRTTNKLGLWLIGADGRHRRRIVSDLAGLSPNFAWAPDGRRLAVYRANLDQIVLVDLHGRQQQILGRGIAVREMDWSPDGRTVYVEGWGRGPLPVSRSCRPGVCALDVRTGKLRQVVSDEQRQTNWGHYWITVSPDSKHIAFVRNCFSGDCRQLPNTDGLVVTNSNGSHARVLVRGAIGSPIWSPDGRSIAYVNQYTGAGQPQNTVEVVSVSNGSVTTLRAFPAEPPADKSPPAVQLLSWQSR